jgi:hypothetical protein
MPQAGFESTIPVFERSKIIRALDRAATGTGSFCIMSFFHALNTDVDVLLWLNLVLRILTKMQGTLRTLNLFLPLMYGISSENPLESTTSGTSIGHSLPKPRTAILLLFTVIYGVKVKLTPCFNWAPRHEGVLEEWRNSSTHSLTSALYGGELSGSRRGRFTPRERAPGAHWIGGWVGPEPVWMTWWYLIPFIFVILVWQNIFPPPQS